MNKDQFFAHHFPPENSLHIQPQEATQACSELLTASLNKTQIKR
jgi:hypothetical protein